MEILKLLWARFLSCLMLFAAAQTGAIDINALLKVLHRQKGAAVEADGAEAGLRSSRIGQLFTADWKSELVLSGKAYRVTVGTITAGGDVAPVTGGGAGLVVDQDQPEVIIGVDAGYYLIPMEIHVSAHVDMDLDAEDADIIATVDRTAGVPTSVTGVIETPVNLLDGAAAFPGRAFSAVTADVTDPTVDEILAAVHVQGSLFVDTTAANSSLSNLLTMHYEPSYPEFIAGPMGLYVYWGGVAAVPAICTVVFGYVLASQVE